MNLKRLQLSQNSFPRYISYLIGIVISETELLVSLSTNLIMLIFHSTYKILYQDDESPLSLDTEALPMNDDMQTNSIPRMASNCNNLITGLKTIIKSLGSFVGVFLLLAIYIVGGIYRIIDTLIVNKHIVLYVNFAIVFDKPYLLLQEHIGSMALKSPLRTRNMIN